jgi:hypothetical protein
VHLYDEAHGAEFAVHMALRRVNLTISGRQWCLPESETSCFLLTRVYLDARLVGIGGLVEMQLERQMRASHAAFPGHADAFVQEQEEARVRARLTASPPSSPDAELSRLPGHAPIGTSSVAVALPRRCARSAEEPRIDRWKFLLALVFGIGLKARRRHHVLPSNGCANATAVAAGRQVGTGSDTVVVRVERRHARWLVPCGCASVDQDEIVE